ncbi:MAG: MG2 domain-containing protein [Desulfomonilaceae bacterium]|nr:MG2 domain-containing protein [Desulfomonilaceae bacterium]
MIRNAVELMRAGLAAAVLILIVPALAYADQLTVHARRDLAYQRQDNQYWGVALGFNHPVFPSNLAESAVVTANRSKLKFQVRVPDGSKIASRPAKTFLIVPATPRTERETVKVTIRKGLSDASGRRLLADNYTYQFVSIERVRVTGTSTFYRSKRDRGLILQLSAYVPRDAIVQAVEIVPSVKNLNIGYDSGPSFRITGDFEYDRDYVLKISAKPFDSGRGILVGDEFPFKGPGVSTSITPKTKRSVVELLGRQLYPLSLSNVTKIQCGIKKIPPFLIPDVATALPNKDAMNELDLPRQVEELKSLAAKGKVNPVFAGDLVEEAEVFFAPEAREHVLGYSMPLSFRENPKVGGAWIVSLSDADSDYDSQVTEPIQITDLSISYKVSAESVLIWVTSIYSGLPVPNVEMLLYRSDGTRYFVGKTDAEGLLLVKDGNTFPAVIVQDGKRETSPQPMVLGDVTWAVAATPTDACAIELSSLRLKPFAVKQTKTQKEKPEALRGQVFTERGVYRPGETVHFKVVSRAFKDKRIVSPEGAKMTVEIQDPRGDVHYKKVLTLSRFGSCYDTLATESFSPVGTYTIKVTPDTGQGTEQAFSATFMVQEFKRARHYAAISIKRGTRPSEAYVGLEREDEFLSVDVSGQYYTGGPVKNGRVRWKATLVPVENKVAGLTGYFFGNEDDATRFLESGESTLDGDGKLQLVVPLDPKLLTGIYGIRISATVLDIDGEPATEVDTFSPKPNYLVGISRHPKQVQAGYAGALKVVVANQQGEKLDSGTVNAEIMRRQYVYIRKRDSEGNINYLWEDGWMKDLSVSQALEHGEATFRADMNQAGTYLIVFTFEDESGRYSSQTLLQVGWEGYDDMREREQQEEVRTSNEILLSMDKNEYAAGETVQVQFTAPRPMGKCLVSFERGEIFEYRVVDIARGQSGFQFTMEEEYIPNVYVSVIAPVGREGFPVYTSQTDADVPMVYYGFANISATSEAQKLALDIAPGIGELKAKPAETKRVAFKVVDQTGKGVKAEMAVCVVDEAVLALTGFRTPSLSTLTRFDLPLSVFSGDLRLDLVSQDLYRILSTKPLTGGDEGSGMVSPSLRKDFRPVAYFNPAVITNDAGEAEVQFTLPDTTTAYRVYAVVCNEGSGFVSGQRTMVVTKEFFIEPSVPRFLIPGDQATFPVVLHNKTEHTGEYAGTSESSRVFDVRPEKFSGSLNPLSSGLIKATALVKTGTDEGKLRFMGRLTIDSERYDDAIELNVPILSRYLPVFRAGMGSFVGSTKMDAEFPEALKSLDKSDLNPLDFKANLMLSTTNWSKIAPGLKYLLRYPFGCVEQTSSGIIPLAGIRELAKSSLIPGITAEDTDKFLKGGIDRLLSMQTTSGGFAYWPGDTLPSWWGTMYAVFALISARERGFEVPDTRLDKALDYLRKNLFDTKKDPLHGQAWTRELAVFNLAMGGKLNGQELAVFFEQYDKVGQQSKALLLLAAHKIGYLSKDLLADKVGKLDPRADPKRTGYDDSSYREIAACLLAAVEIGGAPKKADEWAGLLLAGLNPEGRWYSTADTGWCLQALSKYFETRKTDEPVNFKVTIQYGDEKPLDVNMSDAASFVTLDPLKLVKTGRIELKSESKRLINYTLDLTYPDVVTDPSDLSHGFALTKKYENLNGKQEIRVGDVIRVTLEIDLSPTSRRAWDRKYEYLALVDPVPAGIVPINSELKSEGVEEEKKPSETYYEGFYDFTPSYSEFRDDGVRVFKNRAWGGRYRYTYLARAVAEGDFWMRASRISLMYNPEVFGRTKGARVKILPAR